MALVLPHPVNQMLQHPEVAVAAEVLLAEVVVPVVAAVLAAALALGNPLNIILG